MGITDKIEVSTIANVLHFQSFCFAYFLVFVVIVVTLSSLVTWPHKKNFWKSTIDGKRATKSTSARTHTVAQWLVSSNLDLRTRRQKREKLDLNYHGGNCCCGLCGQLEQQQPSCDKRHHEKTRKGHRIIVSRGDWLGNPAKIKDENNGTVVFMLEAPWSCTTLCFLFTNHNWIN